MPITQDNAGLHLPLLYQWLQNSLREGGDGPEQRLCQAAIQKLQEYIRLNFAVDESSIQPDRSPPGMEICTVYLTKELGDAETVGLSNGSSRFALDMPFGAQASQLGIQIKRS